MKNSVVKQNELALKYVKYEECEEIAKIACKNDGLALAHISKQTKEICLIIFYL